MATKFPATVLIEQRYEVEVLIDAWEDADGLRLDLQGQDPYRGALNEWKSHPFSDDAFKAVVQAAVNGDEEIREEARQKLDEQLAEAA